MIYFNAVVFPALPDPNKRIEHPPDSTGGLSIENGASGILTIDCSAVAISL